MALNVGQTVRGGGTQSVRRRRTGGGSGQTFALTSEKRRPVAAQVGGSGTIAPLGALLAVQEDDQKKDERRRAAARGQQILDILDELKLGLLSGRISQSKIRHLEQAVDGLILPEADAKLRDLLNQVLLRARVELAKLGQ